MERERDPWMQARIEGLPPMELLINGLPLDERVTWLRTLFAITTLPEVTA